MASVREYYVITKGNHSDIFLFTYLFIQFHADSNNCIDDDKCSHCDLKKIAAFYVGNIFKYFLQSLYGGPVTVVVKKYVITKKLCTKTSIIE